jgi:hypothetical protein
MVSVAIKDIRHSRAGGNPSPGSAYLTIRRWIPAFAGMTNNITPACFHHPLMMNCGLSDWRIGDDAKDRNSLKNRS